MPAAITARSLSSLNDLANSPPSNPPLQLQDEEPLILYIVRVPGSREKVVNAYDVQSSFYYCHLASDQDDMLLQDELLSHQDSNDDFHGDNSRESKQDVQMKQSEPGQPILPIQAPVPSNTKLNHPTGQTIPRKPIGDPNSHNVAKLSQEPVRRILGPRPITNRSPSSLLSGDSQHIDGKNSFRTINNAFQTSQNSLKTENDTILNEAFKSFSPYTNVVSRDRYITLIRRDPATDNQWNIGRLSLSEPKSPRSPNRRPKRRNKDVLIELSVPGYVKFSDQAGDSKTSAFTRHLDFSHTSNIVHNFQSSSPTLQAPQPTFLTPWQTPCVFQTAVTGRTLKCYHSLPDSLLRSSSRIMSGERPQTALVSELRFNLPKIVEKSTMKKKENRRPVSYQAHSHGSLNGLPIISDRSTSSSMSSEREGEGILSESMSSQPMLEIPPTLPPRPRGSTLHHRAHSDNSAPTYQDHTDIDIPLDLSLGQEQAGGGFNGNKAKLGKLIIYGGQGLAMLDLLVAANMSVWFNDVLEY